MDPGYVAIASMCDRNNGNMLILYRNMALVEERTMNKVSLLNMDQLVPKHKFVHMKPNKLKNF